MDNMDGFQRRREKKKEIIRQAAFELFSTFGIQKVTIAEIAKKANVSQVTIYNHFGSKDELFKAVLFEFANNKWKDFEEIVESNLPFPEKIEKIVFNKRELGKMLNQDFINAFLSKDPEIQGFIEEYYNNRTIPMMKKIIEQGKELGYINHDLSTDAIWFYIGLFKETLNRPEIYAKLDKTALLDITNLFFYGLLEKPPMKNNKKKT
ncbi:MAG: hypothetical protein APF76_16630 [Desulfitibacter sp. BRH_c19]|nr:MAG: hypothetical protein APF76_16630 [Desulfitibacter sp. BRH_c19]